MFGSTSISPALISRSLPCSIDRPGYKDLIPLRPSPHFRRKRKSQRSFFRPSLCIRSGLCLYRKSPRQRKILTAIPVARLRIKNRAAPARSRKRAVTAQACFFPIITISSSLAHILFNASENFSILRLNSSTFLFSSLIKNSTPSSFPLRSLFHPGRTENLKGVLTGAPPRGSVSPPRSNTPPPIHNVGKPRRSGSPCKIGHARDPSRTRKGGVEWIRGLEGPAPEHPPGPTSADQLG